MRSRTPFDGRILHASNPSAGVGSDVGVEYIYAIRTTEDGAKGRLKRLPMSAKYTF